MRVIKGVAEFCAIAISTGENFLRKYSTKTLVSVFASCTRLVTYGFASHGLYGRPQENTRPIASAYMGQTKNNLSPVNVHPYHRRLTLMASSSNQPPAAPKYMMEVDGDIYIGRYIEMVESACGLSYKLQFKDGTTWARLVNACIMVHPGHPLSPTGPDQQKSFPIATLKAARRPKLPPRGSWPPT